MPRAWQEPAGGWGPIASGEVRLTGRAPAVTGAVDALAVGSDVATGVADVAPPPELVEQPALMTPAASAATPAAMRRLQLAEPDTPQQASARFGWERPAPARRRAPTARNRRCAMLGRAGAQPSGRQQMSVAQPTIEPRAGPAPAAAVISTVDLTKVYAGTDFAAVDRLNLAVSRGEIFGLLGPNGAGKTTTAGMLTTRVIPTTGSALIGAVDVVAHPALAKQLIGIVSQQNTLDRQLTVRENLYFHGRLFGIGAQESGRLADRLLEQFQLSRWANASVFALSGGMAQRLMVARAILHRPAVLFLDEPTAGLDPQGRLGLWEILRELNAEGQTIMLTTHYMEEADHLCDRVAIMDHGKILALDTPQALKQSIEADTIVTLRANGDAAALAELLSDKVPGVARTRLIDGGVELHAARAERLVPRVVSAAEEGDFDVIDLSVSEPTLENVFINLTGRELRE